MVLEEDDIQEKQKTESSSDFSLWLKLDEKIIWSVQSISKRYESILWVNSFLENRDEDWLPENIVQLYKKYKLKWENIEDFIQRNVVYVAYNKNSENIFRKWINNKWEIAKYNVVWLIPESKEIEKIWYVIPIRYERNM